MKSKLDLAHEWYMKNVYQTTHEKVVVKAWKYADAMYEQLEKRDTKSNNELKNNLMSQVNKEYASDLEELNQHRRNGEWQPDWSQAPEKAEYWAMDGCGLCNWHARKPEISGNIWDFGRVIDQWSARYNYQGSWQDSLRKRPGDK